MTSLTRNPVVTVLPMEECQANLAVFFQLEREILRHESAWLAAVPYWDAKQKIGEHVLEDAHHAESLLKRLHELKTAAEHKQIRGVEVLLREFASAASGDEWLHGLYCVLKPWLAGQFRAYLDYSDALMDAPTHQVIQRILVELEAQCRWFTGYQPQYSTWEQADVEPWLHYLRLLTGGTVVRDGSLSGLVEQLPNRPAGHPDFTVFENVRRDRTFNVVAKRDAKREDGEGYEDKRYAVFYNHIQEMQFAESLGLTLFQTSEMPWAYHHDLARHLADEVRHASMGQARLEQLGRRLTELPMMTQHYHFRANLDPVERFCLMTLVMEASSFEHKRSNIQLYESKGDATSVRYAVYDLHDELLHTNLGHVWVPILLRVYHDARSVQEVVEHCRGLISQVATEYLSKEALKRLKK